MSAPLKIPRAAVDVSLMLEGDDLVQATLFVDPSQGKSSVLAVHALLEAQNRFIPARLAHGAALYNKERLRCVSLAREHLGESLDELYDVYQTVEVATACREDLLVGELLFSAPQERRRVGDYLNQPERFLCLYQEHQVLLLNKRYLVSVKERPCPR